jgi:two-component system, chemotaxis family, chemotaxis protein CheY
VADPRSNGLLLIVEDNEATRSGLVKVVEAAGYLTASAANGREALDYLDSNPSPNLILLDMLLPVLDGWHFLQEIQRINKPVAPIVVTTGTILTRQWAEDHGCAGFVHKPINVQELLQEIEHCISTKGQISQKGL